MVGLPCEHEKCDIYNVKKCGQIRFDVILFVQLRFLSYNNNKLYNNELTCQVYVILLLNSVIKQ